MIPKNVLKLAESLAHESKYRFKLGAVIFSGNKILGGGFNDPKKTHPKANTPYKTIHAEFSAAIASKKTSFRNASIYVHRIRRDGKIGLAKPCVHCTAMLKHLGLENVFYSTDNERIEKL